MAYLNVGFDNMVATDKIVAITAPEGASIKRLIQHARDNHFLIDVTTGRKTRSVVFTADHYVILSAIQPETLIARSTDV